MHPQNARIAQGLIGILTPLLPPGFEVWVEGDRFGTSFQGQWLGSGGVWFDAGDTPEALAQRWLSVLDGVQNDVMHFTALGWPIWQDQGSDFGLELDSGVLSLWVENLSRTERLLLGRIPLS